MTTWAIVPVKPFHAGKSRLKDVLTDAERYLLNKQLLLQTLDTLEILKNKITTLVVSRDDQVMAIARQAGCNTLIETGVGGLNEALYQANNTLDKNRDRAIIIPIDLPLMKSAHIERLLSMGEEKPSVVVLPDKEGNGTNILLVNPVGCIRYRFGNMSSKKHLMEAQKRGIKTIKADIPDLSMDLDGPGDLRLMIERGFIIPVRFNKSVEENVP